MPDNDIGQMRQRVTLQRKYSLGNGPAGDEVFDYLSIQNYWAQVEPLSGRELFNAQQNQATTTHKIRMRVNSPVEPGDRLIYPAITPRPVEQPQSYTTITFIAFPGNLNYGDPLPIDVVPDPRDPNSVTIPANGYYVGWGSEPDGYTGPGGWPLSPSPDVDYGLPEYPPELDYEGNLCDRRIFNVDSVLRLGEISAYYQIMATELNGANR